MKNFDLVFKNALMKRYLDGEKIAAISRETGVSAGVLHKWKEKLVRTESGEMDREKPEMRSRELLFEIQDGTH